MAKYEVDRFESPPDPDLVCCICQCVLYKPLESPCQHVFCKVCIETWLTNRKNCPNCRKSLRVSKLKPVLPIVRNMINRLLIKCDNRKHGCRDKIKLEYYDSHVKECGFMPLKCMNTGCEDTVLRKDMLNHEKQCQFRLVVCKKGCGMPIAAEKAHSHNCVAVLKDNIKAMEEAHNRKCKDFERRLKELEEQVKQILANNESRNADDYEYDWCPGPSPTPAHNDMEGGDGSYWDDDCSPMGTPEYYDTPTSEEMAFQGEEPPQHGHDDDDYTDGRDTPINVEDQESNWSWLNEDERGDNVEDDDQSEVSDFEGSTEAILSSGEGAEEDDDDGSDHSGSETSHHESRDGEEGVEHTDGSYADHASSEPSSTERRGQRASSGRGSSSQNERERAASSYSLRSAGSSGVTESDEPITATSTSESTSEVVYVDSTPETSNRRGGNRSRSSAAPTTSQEETPSSSSGTSTTMPISLRLDRLAEMDSASDRTWSPSTRSEEHQESSSRGEQTTTASLTSANSRGTFDNTASRSETSRRRDRSRSNERDRRHRSRDRRRSSTYYSSDEDRGHRSSRRSSTKRSRRR